MMLGIACVALSTWATPAFAQENREAEWTFEGEAQGPLSLSGYRTSETFTFLIPAGWSSLDEATLELTTVASPQLAADAGLTVAVNDVPVYSSAVSPESQDHVVSIPGDLLLPGENSVEIDAIVPLATDLACVDPNHPGRWVLVAGGPTLTATLSPTEALTVRDFPDAFTPLGSIPAPITIVLPPEAGADELSAAAAVVFAASRDGVDADWDVVFDDDGAAAEVAGPAVIIGGKAPEGVELGLEGSALLTRSPPGEPVLTLAAARGGSVLAVADALADPLTIIPLDGGVLDVMVGPARTARTSPESFRLTDVGYGERTVVGLGERSLIYRFDVPFEWEPRDGAMTGRIVADPGGLAVALNGRDVTSQQILASEGGTTLQDVVLPEDAVRPGRNFLRFSFDLEDPEECRDSGARPTGSVSPATMLDLPHRLNGGRLDLADYPYMFAAEVDMAQLTIVLPEVPTLGEIAAGLGVVESLGGSDSRFAPRLVTTSDVNGVTRSGHLIIMGEPARQRLVGELRNALPVRLDVSGRPLEAAEVEIAGEAVGPASVQLLPSPWVEHRMVMVVTGPTVSSFEAATAATVGEGQVGSMSGQVALVGEADRRGTIPVLSLEDRVVATGDAASFVTRVPLAVRIVMLLAIAIAAATASTLFRRRPLKLGKKASSGSH